MQTNRRAFVKASGMAAVLGTTSLAGCNILGGGDGAGGAGSWLYDPTAVADVPNTFFGSMAYGTLYDNRDSLPQSMQDSFETSSDSPIQPGDIDDILVVGGGTVSQDMQSVSAFGSGAVTGSIPRSDIESEIGSQEDAEEAGSYEGYTLYSVTSIQDSMSSIPGQDQFQGSGTVAVGDSAMVAGLSFAQNSESSASGETAVKTMIDASAGNAKQLADASGAVTDVRDRIGDSMMALGAAIDPKLVEVAQQMSGGGGGMAGQMLPGIQGGGFGADIDGATTTYTFVVVYESEQRATDSGVADLVSGMSSQLEQQEGINSVESTQDGAVVEVEISGDTQTLLEQGANAGPMLNVAGPGQ